MYKYVFSRHKQKVINCIIVFDKSYIEFIEDIIFCKLDLHYNLAPSIKRVALYRFNSHYVYKLSVLLNSRLTLNQINIITLVLNYKNVYDKEMRK